MKEPDHNSTVVALQYDGTCAPQVTAKGRGEIADEIIRLAREHDIPLYEDVELVNLLARLDLGDEIPEALYITVARVIAFAYSLAGKTAPQVDKPAK